MHRPDTIIRFRSVRTDFEQTPHEPDCWTHEKSDTTPLAMVQKPHRNRCNGRVSTHCWVSQSIAAKADPSKMLLNTAWVKSALPVHALVPVALYGAPPLQFTVEAFVGLMSMLNFSNPVMVKLLGCRLLQLVCLTSPGSGVTEQPLVTIWFALGHSTARRRLMGLHKLVIWWAAEVMQVRIVTKATLATALRLLASVSLLNHVSSLACIPEVVVLTRVLGPCYHQLK